MATLPYNVPANHMTNAPTGVAWSVSGQPPGTLDIDASGNLTAGVATAAGTFTATVTATIDGNTQTMDVSYVVTEPGSAPSSAWFAAGPLNSASSYTLNGSDVSVLANQVSGDDMVQATAANQPTLTTYNGASVMQFVGGEALEISLPDTNVFHVTMRLVLEQVNDGSIQALVYGGDSTFVYLFDDGNAAGSVHLNAGTPSVRINGVAQTPSSRDAAHDLLYDGTNDAVVTITILDIDPTAHPQWTDDAVWFFGFKNNASFSGTYKVAGVCVFSDASEASLAENFVGANDQSITAL